MESGYNKGKVTLRRMMFQQAEKNPGVLIFLAKNILGYRDFWDARHTGPDGGPVELSHLPALTPMERKARIDELNEKRRKAIEGE
jgi:hypothetical protein